MLDFFAGLASGIIVGVTGSYLGSRLTDWRKDREKTKAVRKKFADLKSKMPVLIAEMAEDVKREPLVRLFVLIHREYRYNFSRDEPFFHYDHEAHPDLIAKVKLLEAGGFIVDDHITNVPRYRMTEDFVKLLPSASSKPQRAAPPAPAR